MTNHRSSRIAVTLVPPLVGLTLLAACTDAGPAEARSRTTATADAPGPNAPGPEITVEPVKLLEAGSPPHEVLRLDLEASAAPVERRLVTESLTVMTIDGRDQPRPTPRMTLPLSATVATTDRDDRFRMTIDVGEPLFTVPSNVKAEFVEGLARQLAGIEDVVLGVEFSTSGEVLLVDARGTERLSAIGRSELARLETALRTVMPRFPEEPVGPGARWTLHSRISQSGLSLDQTTTFTLNRRTPEALEIGIEIEQTATGDEVRIPNAPPGQLQSFSGDGTGVLKIDRSLPLPTLSETENHIQMALSFDVPEDSGLPRKASNDSHIRLRLETPE